MIFNSCVIKNLVQKIPTYLPFFGSWSNPEQTFNYWWHNRQHHCMIGKIMRLKASNVKVRAFFPGFIAVSCPNLSWERKQSCEPITQLTCSWWTLHIPVNQVVFCSVELASSQHMTHIYVYGFETTITFTESRIQRKYHRLVPDSLWPDIHAPTTIVMPFNPLDFAPTFAPECSY